MKLHVANMPTDKLITTIRAIEASPSAHRTWKVQQMVDENLAAMRSELRSRGVNV